MLGSGSEASDLIVYTKRLDGSSKGLMDLPARRLFKICATTQC